MGVTVSSVVCKTGGKPAETVLLSHACLVLLPACIQATVVAVNWRSSAGSPGEGLGAGSSQSCCQGSQLIEHGMDDCIAFAIHQQHCIRQPFKLLATSAA